MGLSSVVQYGKLKVNLGLHRHLVKQWGGEGRSTQCDNQGCLCGTAEGYLHSMTPTRSMAISLWACSPCWFSPQGDWPQLLRNWTAMIENIFAAPLYHALIRMCGMLSIVIVFGQVIQNPRVDCCLFLLVPFLPIPLPATSGCLSGRCHDSPPFLPFPQPALKAASLQKHLEALPSANKESTVFMCTQ